MSLVGWLQIGLLVLFVFALIRPLGLFMARVFKGDRTFLSPVLGPVERVFHAASGIDPKSEQGWLAYTLSMLAFSMAGFSMTTGFSAPASTGSSTRPGHSYTSPEKVPVWVQDFRSGEVKN